ARNLNVSACNGSTKRGFICRAASLDVSIHPSIHGGARSECHTGRRRKSSRFRNGDVVGLQIEVQLCGSRLCIYRAAHEQRSQAKVILCYWTALALQTNFLCTGTRQMDGGIDTEGLVWRKILKCQTDVVVHRSRPPILLIANRHLPILNGQLA